MKWAYYIKYKVRTVAFLATILVIVLLGNIFERNSYSTLDDSITSIYKDRLEVSQYIYEISSSLYQKKLLLSEADIPNERTRLDIASLNNFIGTQIDKYEKTVLTKEERNKWLLFKENLFEYKTLEQQWLNSPTEEEYERTTSQFLSTVKILDGLSNIQVAEGLQILEDSHGIVSSRLSFSTFEITLLIILGLFSLIIISAVDERIFKNLKNRSLN